MYIANSRATSKKAKKKKRSVTDMLRKKGKWNHIKYSIKKTKGRKRMEDKNRQTIRATNRKQ